MVTFLVTLSLFGIALCLYANYRIDKDAAELAEAIAKHNAKGKV